MINVKIDENVLKRMLYERLNWWDIDNKTYEYVEEYFLNMIDNGGFEGTELNVRDFIDKAVVMDWEK